MKKFYLLAAALYFCGFSNASTIKTGDNPISIKASKNAFATNDVQVVSAKLDKFLVAGAQTYIKAVVKNVGTNSISSIEINWNDGTGDHKERIVAYISPGQQKEVTHPIPTSYTDVSTKTITVSVTKVNDADDADPSNNSANVMTSVVSQFIPKKVVFEEGTGTWCGWCPRGMVALKQVNEDFPDDQISIGVHNSDPMVVAAYNSGAAFSGFPGMNVDRELKGVDVSPSSIGNYVTNRKQMASPVNLSGDFSIVGDQLTANASAKFFINNPTTNYKMSVVVIEDGVVGTAAGYKQANYYANNAQGEMGGFESLPNPVPADKMVYDHVGRALLGGYSGQAGSVPTAISVGTSANYTFNYTVPAEYKSNNISLALLLIDGADGTIISAAKLNKTLAVNDVSKIGANTTIFPNPAHSEFNIKLTDDATYKITIFDMNGREVKNYGEVKSNSKNIKLQINNLTPGKYLVNIAKDGVSFTKNLLVK
ncbi:Omp28-related outer membrane protein [Soonwooa sp.]|uniref:T9SS type A sorting domain-containing protein n=1 Tax=Soonwooa sp. TaxID=1938592 RepID=UPI0026252C81|nr:Omp28-related outer membrane protein [Soonwooa sp.]